MSTGQKIGIGAAGVGTVGAGALALRSLRREKTAQMTRPMRADALSDAHRADAAQRGLPPVGTAPKPKVNKFDALVRAHDLNAPHVTTPHVPLPPSGLELARAPRTIGARAAAAAGRVARAAL
jgi:hypothetical protein